MVILGLNGQWGHTAKIPNIACLKRWNKCALQVKKRDGDWLGKFPSTLTQLQKDKELVHCSITWKETILLLLDVSLCQVSKKDTWHRLPPILLFENVSTIPVCQPRYCPQLPCNAVEACPSRQLPFYGSGLCISAWFLELCCWKQLIGSPEAVGICCWVRGHIKIDNT